MSVILATPGDAADVAVTLRHLATQTVRHLLEIVLVTPSASRLAIDPTVFQGFWGHQVVEFGSFSSIARANALGVHRARGEVVAFAEDHCFPDAPWAEALLAAHREPWAVVGPVFRNANPSTIVSWCDFLIGYAPWMEPAPLGPMPFLPGHNSSYKRAVLLAYGDDLEAMLEAEAVLHLDLGRQGHRLLLEPRARVAHLNFASMPVWVRVQYLCGRVFAGTRALRWGMARRLLFAAGSPLIPLVRLGRTLRELHRPERPRHLAWRLLPTLLVGLAMDGAGQAVGYLAGCGDATGRLARFEFHRIAYVTEEDRRMVASLRDVTER